MTSKQFHPFIRFILLAGVLYADGFDTLTYKQKFDATVQNYQEGRFRLAATRFKSILENDKDNIDPASQLMLAKSLYRMGDYTQASQTVKIVINRYSNSPYTIHAKVLLGDISLAYGLPTKAFKSYLDIRPTVSDTVFLAELDERILNTIGLGLKEDRIEGYFFRESHRKNRIILNIVRAYIAWIRGDEYDLKNAISGLSIQDVPIAYRTYFERLIASLQQPLSSQNTIAVIIPLSGFDQQDGVSYLLGLSDFLEKPADFNSVRFLVFDTQGDAIQSLATVKQLGLEQSVLCILGPLKESELFALSGLQISLPILVPKASPKGLSDLAPNIFSLAPSKEILARRTAQLMVNHYGFETIAVVSPGDESTASMTNIFLDELFQLGVDPVAVEWYHERPEDISRQFNPIRKLAWDLIPDENPDDEMMHLAIDSLDALFDVDVDDFFDLPEEEEKMSTKDSSKVVLETIDAIYLPIRKDELTYVGTQLPMYNLKTTVIGNPNWIDMDILNQDVIGPHVQGMKIISGVNANQYQSYHDSFAYHYHLALDHGTFIQSILEQRVMNRRLFMEKLKTHPGYAGNISSIRFLGQNQNENGLVQVLDYEGHVVNNTGVFDGKNIHKGME